MLFRSGAIKLLDHSFVREVRDAEARDVRDSAYRLERDKDGVKAVLLKVEEKKPGGVSMGIYDISRGLTPLGWGVLVLGVLGGMVAIGSGLWKLLRVIKKNHNEAT